MRQFTSGVAVLCMYGVLILAGCCDANKPVVSATTLQANGDESTTDEQMPPMKVMRIGDLLLSMDAERNEQVGWFLPAAMMEQTVSVAEPVDGNNILKAFIADPRFSVRNIQSCQVITPKSFSDDRIDEVHAQDGAEFHSANMLAFNRPTQSPISELEKMLLVDLGLGKRLPGKPYDASEQWSYRLPSIQAREMLLLVASASGSKLTMVKGMAVLMN